MIANCDRSTSDPVWKRSILNIKILPYWPQYGYMKIIHTEWGQGITLFYAIRGTQTKIDGCRQKLKGFNYTDRVAVSVPVEPVFTGSLLCHRRDAPVKVVYITRFFGFDLSPTRSKEKVKSYCSGQLYNSWFSLVLNSAQTVSLMCSFFIVCCYGILAEVWFSVHYESKF